MHIAARDTRRLTWRSSARRLVGRTVAKAVARSGREGQGAESCQGTAELVLPGPVLGKMQGEGTRRARDASGQGEEASGQGLGGRQRLAQANGRGPAGQVVGDDLATSQAALAGKRSEGRWLRPTPYFRSRMAFSISRGGDGRPQDPGYRRPGR